MTSVFFPQTIDLSASAVQLIETSRSNPKVTLDESGLKSFDALGNLVAALLAGGEAIETAIQLPAAQTYTQSLQYLVSFLVNGILSGSILNWADLGTDGKVNYSELDLSTFITEVPNTKSVLKLLTETIDQFNNLRTQLTVSYYDGGSFNIYERQGGADFSGFLIAANKLSEFVSDPTVALQNLGFTGMIIPTIRTSAPNGWLLCDGSAVSRTGLNAALFNLIGTTYGAGDGSTTFNLPDFRGRVIVGAGAGSGLTNRNLGDTGGEETHLLTIAETPSHNHTGLTGTGTTGGATTGTGTSGSTTPGVTDPGHNHAPLAGTFLQSGTSGGTSLTSGGTFNQAPGSTTGNRTTGLTVNAHTHSVPGLSIPGLSVPALSIPSQGGGGSHNNMQPFGVANWLIHR